MKKLLILLCIVFIGFTALSENVILVYKGMCEQYIHTKKGNGYKNIEKNEKLYCIVEFDFVNRTYGKCYTIFYNNKDRWLGDSFEFQEFNKYKSKKIKYIVAKCFETSNHFMSDEKGGLIDGIIHINKPYELGNDIFSPICLKMKGRKVEYFSRNKGWSTNILYLRFSKIETKKVNNEQMDIDEVKDMYLNK